MNKYKLTPEEDKEIGNEVVSETEALFNTEERRQKLCKELDVLAFSDLADYFSSDGEIRPIEELRSEGKTPALKKIKKTKGVGKSGNEYETIEMDLHAKLDAIKELVSIMGIRAAEKHRLEAPILEEILAQIHAKRSKAQEKLSTDKEAENGNPET